MNSELTQDMLFELANDFYCEMDRNTQYHELRAMHPSDLAMLKYDFGMFLTVFFDLPDRPFTKYQSTK